MTRRGRGGGESSTMKASSVSVKSLTTSSRRRVLPTMLSRLAATASRMSADDVPAEDGLEPPVAVEAHVEDRDGAAPLELDADGVGTMSSDGSSTGPSLTRLRRVVRALRSESRSVAHAARLLRQRLRWPSASPWPCRPWAPPFRRPWRRRRRAVGGVGAAGAPSLAPDASRRRVEPPVGRPRALAVVGGVEAGALEVDGHRVQHLAQVPAALLARLERIVAHLLEDLEGGPAVVTAILVDGHAGDSFA